MLDHNKQRFTSWPQRLIAFIGAIVPRRFRTRWRREWEAELEYREALLAKWDKLDWRSKLELLWRSLGAFWDALWLQRQRWEDEMMQDLRYGARMLLKHKAFTLVAVLSLALGIGANTAIFSFVDTVLIKMLPVKNPEQLVFLERGDVPPGPQRYLSYAFFEQARTQQEMFAGVCTFAIENRRVNAVLDGQSEMAKPQRVSGGFFAVLGVNAMLGRTITEEDDKVPGAHPVVVLSHRYWQRRFARDSAIVGKTISLNGYPFTIIGVTPPEFFGAIVGEAPDFWTPTMMYAQLNPGSSIKQYFNNPVFVLARLKPEVSEQQARTRLTGLWQQTVLEEIGGIELSPERQQALRQQNITLVPASRGLAFLRAQFSEPLRILMAVVGLILLIACVNVANLLLARAMARQQEIAVRLALGASRFRLIRQLLTESLLLAGLGGALGLAFAWWSRQFLLTLVASGHTPIALNVTLDARVLAFTAAASLLAGVLFGLAPAWRATRVDLTPALKDSARSSEGGARLSLGKSLVVVQVALSLSLLIGAGLFVRSLAKLKSLDAGFKPENVLLVSTDPRLIGYQGKQISALYARLLERFKALPGVRSVSLSRQGLLSDGNTKPLMTMYIQGQPTRLFSSKEGQFYRPFVSWVGPDFFETVGMTILRGRSFTAQDFAPRDNPNAPRAVIVNETFARHYFGDSAPLGQRFGFSADKSDGLEIVGIVKDAKHNSLREQTQPTYYLPALAQDDTTFQLRTVADPTRLITAVRQAVREVDANLTLYGIKTLAAQVDETLVQERMVGTLSSFFGLLSLLLAAVGVYGVMAYAVSQRTREIGIRMALGAPRSVVLRMVLRQGLILILLGLGFGLAASFATTRLLESQLFGITPTDLVTFIAAPILLLIVALLACFIPARRATKVDPLIALRNE